MTVSSTTTQNSYSGNGSTTEFAITFKYLAKGDISVTLIDDATGAETTWVETTNYTLTAPGETGTLTALVAPASGETLVINRQMAATQVVDYVENDPFPADTHEEALDRLTMLIQQLGKEIAGGGGVIEVNAVRPADTVTDDPNVTFSGNAAARANRFLGFDSLGDITILQEIGTYRGTDATTTTQDYVERDLVKDSSNNNIYLCTADSSSGTLLTNTSYWALIVDAASATASAAAAAASESAAATSASNAATSESNAATSESNASTSASNASTSASNAATSETNAAASAAAAATSEANAATSEANAAATLANALQNDTTDNLSVGYTTDIHALGSVTSITPDVTAEWLKSATITGNLTINEVTDGNEGGCIILLTADASGPYTVTLGTGVSAIGTIPDLAASTSYQCTVIKHSNDLTTVEIVEIG